MIEMTGGELAEIIETSISNEIKKGCLKLSLAVILIGSDKASEKYVALKQKACEKVNINFLLFRFTEKNSQIEILSLINKLNNDKNITGIMIQLPVPTGFVVEDLLEEILPTKDVDGLNSANFGKLEKNIPGLYPATAEGIINLLRYYQIQIAGKRVLVIGQGYLVGRPLISMLLNENATVLTANIQTKNLAELTAFADIIVSAAGCPKLLKGSMVKKNAVIIDAGTSLYHGKLTGDVDFSTLSSMASYITPNPGGVGPMTVAMLLSNVVKAGRL